MRKRKAPQHHYIKRGAAILTFLVLFSFFVSVTQRLAIFRSGFLADVLPNVLIDLTNKNREKSQIQKLAYSPVLEEAAKRKANDMATKSYFAHTSPEGVTPWQWFRDVNYGFIYAGENLAVHFSDSSDVVRAWMDSPGHRDNILNEHFTEIGIATAQGYFEGRQTIFVVQMFGRPSIPRTPIFEAEEVLANESDQTLALNNSEAEAVLGEEIKSDIQGETALDESEIVEVIKEGNEKDKFIVVQNTKELENNKNIHNEVQAGPASDYSNVTERLLSSPSSLLKFVYVILASIIIALIFMALFVELENHHYLHLAYGLILIVIMIVIYIVYNQFFDVVEVLGQAFSNL